MPICGVFIFGGGGLRNIARDLAGDYSGCIPSETQEGIYEAEGVVDRVVYANEDNGYHVVELLCGGDILTVVGDMPQIFPGERLKVTGKFVTHSSYGKQLEVQSSQRRLPDNREDILRYLMSGAVKGVGPISAERIFNRFGDETLLILENDPMQIAEVRGFSHKKAVAIAEELTKLFDLRRMMLYLSGYGLRPSESVKTIRALGEHTMQLVEDNPYILCCNAIGLDFTRVDSLAFERGFEYNNDNRLCAGVLHVLRHNLQNGHTCLPTEKLLGAAQTLLRCEPELTENALNCQMAMGEVLPVTFGERQFCYLSKVLAAEKYIADRMHMLSHADSSAEPVSDEELAELEKAVGITYENVQKEAVKTAIAHGTSIITGGPGTGKTTILYAVLRLLQNRGLKVTLAAPTGRAAKRMSELVGWEATTIHRLLDSRVGGAENRYLTFGRNEESPLDSDAVIIDEASMCDVFVMEGLLRAMHPGTKLILVGDADQLPAVGAGNIMRDLTSSGKIPLIRLTEIYRQAASSLIVVNAHRINSGEPPILNRKDKDNDFFFMPIRTEHECVKTLVSLCSARLPARYGWSPFTDIQVLTPGRKGALGTIELNKKLQAVLNPPSGSPQFEFEGFSYRIGDKIMQTHNDYDIMWTRNGEAGVGLYNGDTGIVTGIDKAARLLYADFDGRQVCFTSQQLIELEPAYACTVHKSQGSEFEAVVIPLFPAYSEQLMYRNLLYTAVTRAKKMLVIVGNEATVMKMVSNEKKALRYTGLKKFLLGLDKGVEP